jgi:hypothetical protein
MPRGAAPWWQGGHDVYAHNNNNNTADEKKEAEQIFYVGSTHGDGGSVLTDGMSMSALSQQELIRKKARSESKKRKLFGRGGKKKKTPIVSLPPGLLGKNGSGNNNNNNNNNSRRAFYSSSSMPSSVADPPAPSRGKRNRGAAKSSPLKQQEASDATTPSRSWKAAWSTNIDKVAPGSETTDESTYQTESLTTPLPLASLETPYSTVPPTTWTVQMNETEGDSFMDPNPVGRPHHDEVCSIDEYSFPLLSTDALGGILDAQRKEDDGTHRERHMMAPIPESPEFLRRVDTSSGGRAVRFSATAELSMHSTLVQLPEGESTLETDETSESDRFNASSSYYLSYQIELDSPTSVADILHKSLTAHQPPTPTKRRSPSHSPAQSILRPGRYGDRNGGGGGGLKKAYVRAMSYRMAAQIAPRRYSYEDVEDEEPHIFTPEKDNEGVMWVPAVPEDDLLRFVDPHGAELSPIRESRSAASEAHSSNKSDEWSDYEDSETMQRLHFIEAVAAVVIQTGYRRYLALRWVDALRSVERQRQSPDIRQRSREQPSDEYRERSREQASDAYRERSREQPSDEYRERSREQQAFDDYHYNERQQPSFERSPRSGEQPSDESHLREREQSREEYQKREWEQTNNKYALRNASKERTDRRVSSQEQQGMASLRRELDEDLEATTELVERATGHLHQTAKSDSAKPTSETVGLASNSSERSTKKQDYPGSFEATRFGAGKDRVGVPVEESVSSHIQNLESETRRKSVSDYVNGMELDGLGKSGTRKGTNSNTVVAHDNNAPEDTSMKDAPRWSVRIEDTSSPPIQPAQESRTDAHFRKDWRKHNDAKSEDSFSQSGTSVSNKSSTSGGSLAFGTRRTIVTKPINTHESLVRSHTLPLPQRKLSTSPPKKELHLVKAKGGLLPAAPLASAMDFEAAVKIQSIFRGFWIRDCINVDHYCAMVIQKAFRGYMTRVNFQYDRYRIIIVQSVWRRSLARSDVAHVLACAILIQSLVRKFLARRQRKHLERGVVFDAQNNAAALIIQCSWRRYWCESVLIRTLVDVLISQSVARGWLGRQERKKLKAAKMGEQLPSENREAPEALPAQPGKGQGFIMQSARKKREVSKEKKCADASAGDESDLSSEPGLIPPFNMAPRETASRSGRPPISPALVKLSKVADKYEQSVQPADEDREESPIEAAIDSSTSQKVQIIPSVAVTEQPASDQETLTSKEIQSGDEGSKEGEMSALTFESSKDGADTAVLVAEDQVETYSAFVADDKVEANAVLVADDKVEATREKRMLNAQLSQPFVEGLSDDHPYKGYYQLWASKGLLYPKAQAATKALDDESIQTPTATSSSDDEHKSTVVEEAVTKATPPTEASSVESPPNETVIGVKMMTTKSEPTKESSTPTLVDTATKARKEDSANLKTREIKSVEKTVLSKELLPSSAFPRNNEDIPTDPSDEDLDLVGKQVKEAISVTADGKASPVTQPNGGRSVISNTLGSLKSVAKASPVSRPVGESSAISNKLGSLKSVPKVSPLTKPVGESSAISNKLGSLKSVAKVSSVSSSVGGNAAVSNKLASLKPVGGLAPVNSPIEGSTVVSKPIGSVESVAKVSPVTKPSGVRVVTAKQTAASEGKSVVVYPEGFAKGSKGKFSDKFAGPASREVKPPQSATSTDAQLHGALFKYSPPQEAIQKKAAPSGEDVESMKKAIPFTEGAESIKETPSDEVAESMKKATPSYEDTESIMTGPNEVDGQRTVTFAANDPHFSAYSLWYRKGILDWKPVLSTESTGK